MPRNDAVAVEIIYDVNNDKAVRDAIREQCAADPRCLLIAPGPRAGSTNALAEQVLAELGVDPMPWPVQLTFACLDPPSSPSRQLTLPFTPPPRRFGWWPDRRSTQRTVRSLDHAVFDTVEAKITDLYVLSAHVIGSSGWTALVYFARDCRLRLHLVVHGGADIHERLRCISAEAVTSRTVVRMTPATPWWERPAFRRVTARGDVSGPVRMEAMQHTQTTAA